MAVEVENIVEQPIAEEPPRSASEIRQQALAALMPVWIQRRGDVAEASSEAEEAKGTLKAAKERLARHEEHLQHVGQCALDPCGLCALLARNPEWQPPKEDRKGPKQLGLDEAPTAPMHGYRLNSRCPVVGCEGRLSSEAVEPEDSADEVYCDACGAGQKLDGAGTPIQQDAEGRYEDELGADDIIRTVTGCSACGGQHERVLMRPDQDVEGAEPLVVWICPTTGDRVRTPRDEAAPNGATTYPSLDEQRAALAEAGLVGAEVSE